MSVKTCKGGYGLLENFLASKRASVANKFIADDLRGGRILDIGCGYYPHFLNTVKFKEKYGLDKKQYVDHTQMDKSINMQQFDIEHESKLPFNDEYFDMVSMLAVCEHIEYGLLIKNFMEIYRILKPLGCLVITTPVFWTKFILSIMAFSRLVSLNEVREHKYLYSQNKIKESLVKSGFQKSKIKSGYFEFGMNMWVVVVK